MCHRFARVLAPLLLVSAAVGCNSSPATPSPGVEEVNFEGLVTVPSKAFDIAQIRPDTNFGRYSRLQIGTPRLAFRTPDRAERQLALTPEQKRRFGDGLSAAFDTEFSKFQVLELVDEPGEATLVLDIRVEDIVVVVTPNAVGRAGLAAAVLEASGHSVIIVEIRDSLSNEILARGVDAGSASGGAARMPEGQMRTRFESADKVVTKWAAKTRASLENLLRERR